MKQYEALRKRNAFLSNYRQQKMFSDDLSEFDHAREVVQNLIDEYAASQREDYLSWTGAPESAQPAPASSSASAADPRAPAAEERKGQQ